MMNPICRTLLTFSIAAVASGVLAARQDAGKRRTPDGQVTLVSQPPPQEQVRQLEEQRRNRLRMREQLNKSLRDTTESLQKATDEFVDDALEAIPGDTAAVHNIVLKVVEAKKALEAGDRNRANRLMRDAAIDTAKIAAEKTAEAVGAPEVATASALVDLGMNGTVLTRDGENIWAWAQARREIQRQIDRNDEALASIDKDLPGARGRARNANAKAKPDEPAADDDTTSHPPTTGRDDWDELDKAIELLRQLDLAALNGLEKTRTTPDGQTVVDDEATLRAIEEEQQREREAIEAERRRNLEARDDATKSLGKFKLSIPPGWVPCTCPAIHPGAGIFVNGVQYHTPLLHCDG